jgi:phage recombination protein Bet
MSTNADVAVRTGSALTIDPSQAMWTDEQRAALRQLGVDEASNGDLVVFLNYAQRTGLDPFSRQIYMIGRNERQFDGSYRKKWTIQASIDGLRIIAQRSGDYAGQVGPEWCGPDGVWRDVWLDPAPPAAARVGVLRTGFVAPLYAVALYREYVGTDKKGDPTRMWVEKGALMIAKCAEALALRKAFPNDLSGIYTSDEMSRADAPTVTPAPAIAAVDYQPLIDAATTLDEVRGIWATIRDDKAMNAHWQNALNAKAADIKADDEATTPDPEPDDEPADGPHLDDVADAVVVDTSGKPTRVQTTRLSQRLEQLGITDKQDVLDWLGAMVGRVVHDKRTLTRDEVQRALDAAALELGEVPDGGDL